MCQIWACSAHQWSIEQIWKLNWPVDNADPYYGFWCSRCTASKCTTIATVIIPGIPTDGSLTKRVEGGYPNLFSGMLHQWSFPSGGPCLVDNRGPNCSTNRPSSAFTSPVNCKQRNQTWKHLECTKALCDCICHKRRGPLWCCSYFPASPYFCWLESTSGEPNPPNDQ